MLDYQEADTSQFHSNFTKKPHKLYCHLVAVERTPFPKLFVTDFIENDGFAAKLDFHEPIDLNGAMILPEEVLGLKVYPERLQTVTDFLSSLGIEFVGSKAMVFDKMKLLCVNIRLSKYFNKNTEAFLEAILDKIEILDPGRNNHFADNVINRFQRRYKTTPHSVGLTYKKAPARNMGRSTGNGVYHRPAIKKELDVTESLPLFEQELEPSSNSEGEGASEVNKTTLNCAYLNGISSQRSSAGIYCVKAWICGIKPSSIRTLTKLNENNTVSLKNLEICLKDNSGAVIKVIVSNNLEILKFLLGDDLTNNSQARLIKLYYNADKVDKMLESIVQQRKINKFFVCKALHRISDDNRQIRLENWGFAKVPSIDELL